MQRMISALCGLAVVLAGCGFVGGEDVELAMAHVSRTAAAPADAAKAAAGINDFGLELFRSLNLGDANAVMSPASVALALAMARAGARGTTAAEMDAVLRGVGSDEHADWLNALDQTLRDRSGSFTDANGDSQEVTLRIANAPFAQHGMTLEAAYLEALASRFGAGLRLVDYAAAPEDARKQINGWVDHQTEGRIPELLAPGVITPDTRLTLVNAIYLKAPWQYPFEASATAPGRFTRADGSAVDVPMMRATYPLSFGSGDGWKAVDLPYVGGQLAMTVIVPDDLAGFEAGLDGARLAEIVGALSEHEVDLRLPRFSVETQASLADALAAMGMPAAFDPGAADFSGVTRELALFIADVIHQANMDVDERGTEAAAATAAEFATALPPPAVLHADRPFLFALRDLESGAVLFLGHVVDPSITD